jgi:hypothetical protein
VRLALCFFCSDGMWQRSAAFRRSRQHY